MTIFDVLRYHITDVFNEEELNTLPTGIFNRWISACIGEPFDCEYSMHNETRSSIVRQVVGSQISNARIGRTGRTAGWLDLHKAKNLKFLKKIIAEYEPI